ncbi:type II secretion system protein GspM [Paucibacter sp. APW11]|uniref:Type II secretion system protein GspM n=1 Tax=Roseateles aquae TaxID=3077235 RepID=A0ABU3PI88_9BURK|nr:type II secretion system protein GspM [Paucibacter sp. APW11]MDT9002174.1 type II secretion system protein GspM [Paucibacter sp. APW11]
MSLPSDKPDRWQALAEPLKTHWQGLGARERLGLQAAGAALALLLVWNIGVRPAWRTLSEGPAQLASADTELQQMQALALEARELREAPPVAPAQALQALKSSSEFLGSKARLSITGDRAVVSFNGVSTEALQNWLGEVRSAARARPIEAQLQRGPQGFNGTVTLALGVAAP